MADEEEIVPLHLLAVERRANSDEAFDLDRISDVRVKRIVDHKAKCESDALTEFAIRHAKEHESDLDKTVYDDHVVITEDDTEYAMHVIAVLCLHLSCIAFIYISYLALDMFTVKSRASSRC